MTISNESKEKVRLRLSKAIGHLNSVSKMVDKKNVLETLNQLKAVQAALDGVAEILIADRVETILQETFCDDSRSAAAAELVKLYKRSCDL